LLEPEEESEDQEEEPEEEEELDLRPPAETEATRREASRE